MAGFVPDASVTLPWCFDDEASPWTESLLNRIVEGEPVSVPAHWSFEVTNGLLIALRRGRVNLEKVHDFIKDLSNLPIQIEKSWHPSVWSLVLALSQQHKLTAYDAAYLELAQRTGLPLATLDGDLQKAARAAGVSLLEPHQRL